jgi:hypothetical protein
VSISLTVDDEFLEYCRINNIQDIEKLARDTFRQGFTILKYGTVPSGIKIEDKEVSSKGMKTSDIIQSEVVVKPYVPLQVIDGSSASEKKNDIYGE